MQNPINITGPIFTRTYCSRIPILVIINGSLHFLHLVHTGSYSIVLCHTLLHFSDKSNFDKKMRLEFYIWLMGHIWMVNLSDIPVSSDYSHQGDSPTSNKTVYIQPTYNRVATFNNYMLPSNLYSDLSD